ncbi:cytochrome P450 [Pluteus cervinus]|uniref:Cytochrome P450 n=1 Tax=Pluteus cervinus TaxID=181527 RepID=A0ACD3BCH8_9AGAR|nr:cytochrome P450 [Pluteus cervinus]
MVTSMILDVVLGLLGLYLLFRVLGRPKATLPGPRPLPIIGNFLDMPKEKEWLTFTEWGGRWGPRIWVSVFGQNTLILNSFQDAVDLLEKRSAICSDRPFLAMGDLTGYNHTIGLTPYAEERFRAIRKFYHQLMGTPTSVSKFYPIEEEENRRFLQQLSMNTENLPVHIRKTASAIILRISHGYRVQESNDPFILLADTATDDFSKILTGHFLVNLVPALKYLPDWIPGTGFKQMARSWAATLDDMVELPHAYVKQQMAQGIAEQSLTSRLLEENVDMNPQVEDHIKCAASAVYSAGSETTAATIHAFFKAMILYPEVQRKAQEEIDAVIGDDMLPTCADRDKLPYVHALILELLRWHTVAPCGVPHRVTEDNIFKGYFIPKGTVVITNLWAMAHDPDLYPDPMIFDPSRFLRTPGHEPQRDPRTITFGFGRRICPGRILAETSIFLSCAMTLAVYDISKVEENGKALVPDPEQMTGLVSHPTPFKFTIRPRSKAAVALINGTI